MSARGAKASAIRPEDERHPLYTLLIEVTQKCNAACDQCGSRCDINSAEFLSKEQILSALRDIRDHIGVYTMLNITGGEPLLRRDLFEIMTVASAMGFEWGMVTNGSLITDETIGKMRASGMKTITISVDGLRETHDSLRHLPGSWDKIMAAIPKLRRAGFLDHIQITFTANRRNVYEFEELYQTVRRLGLDSIRVGFMDPIGRARDNEQLLLTREEMLYLTNLTNRLNRAGNGPKIVWGCPHYMDALIDKRKFLCFAGVYTASILYNGDIFVCPNVERRPAFIQGNILRDSFSEVWRTRFEAFRNRTTPETCENCPHREKCAGDSMHTRDFDTNAPRFCYRDALENPDPAVYRESLRARYPDLPFCEVCGDEETADTILIEPDAYRSIRAYFHMGTANPLSMYEQQMALIGFRAGDLRVVRYVIPCDGAIRRADNAIFTSRILKTVAKELAIINRNYYDSADRALVGSECAPDAPMRFLGFIHSHPTQPALIYSTGDDAIHTRMTRRFGDYVGVLVHPASDAIGAYAGKDIHQAKLIIPDDTSAS